MSGSTDSPTVSFPGDQYQGVTVTGYATEGGTPPGDFLDLADLTVTSALGVGSVPASTINVTPLDSTDDVLSVGFSLGGDFPYGMATEYVLGGSPEGLLVSPFPAQQIANLLDAGIDVDPLLGLITTTPLPVGTTLTTAFDPDGYMLPCLAAGTLIDTPSGPIAVETLRPGDVVSLYVGGTATVAWLGHRRARDAATVRFRPGSLGSGVPRRDLVTSEDHAIAIDGLLVPAGHLANGETILAGRRDVTFFHVELDHHAVLLAEGAPAESYLDTGNRRQFANCPIAYDPARAAVDPCAETLFAGQRLDAIRARLRPVPA